MKKSSFLIAFLFCAAISFAQFTPNPQGTVQQVTQFRGAVTGLRGIMITPNDTLNSPATPYFGALTVLPQDAGKDTITIWMSNGLHWIRFTGGSAFNRNDTIYTRVPIAVDTTSLPGHQILYLLHLDGVVTPGYVIWTGTGLIFNITPANYYINYRQYNSPSTTVTLATADPSLARSDLFYVDTTASAQVLTGMPGGGVPQANPSSQLPLTSIQVNAGDTVPSGIQLETLYNQHIAPPTEWLPTTSGTGTTNFDNTDFPYIGTKAAFTPTYTNGYKIIFTKGSGTDTVKAGEIIRGFLSLNIPLTGQFQFQWFNGATAVSNAIAINSGFGINPNNVGQYQIFAIPLNTWNFNSNIFNKLVITMAGADTSGAGGFYLDFLQLQTGLTTFSSGREVYSYGKNITNDSSILTLADGTRLAASDNSGGTTPTLQTVFNTEVGGSLLLKRDTVKTQSFALKILGTGVNTLEVNNTGTGYAINSTSTGNGITSTIISGGGIGISGDGLSGAGMLGTATTGNGVRAISTSGNGINSTSSTGWPIVTFQTPAITNTLGKGLLIQQGTSLTAGNGIGTMIEYDIQAVNGVSTSATQLISKLTNDTLASKTSEFSILGVNSGSALQTLFTLSGNGAAKLNQYASGTFDVTDTSTNKPATIDASGNVKRLSYWPFSETWQQTLINGSELTQDNTIYLNQRNLLFVNDSSTVRTLFQIDNINYQSQLNANDGVFIGGLQISAKSASNNLFFDLFANDQTGNPYPEVFGNGITRDIGYTAITHTFTGISIQATQFTPANSTDNTYPNGALTQDDTFIYYRTSTGTWKKIPWVVF